MLRLFPFENEVSPGAEGEALGGGVPPDQEPQPVEAGPPPGAPAFDQAALEQAVAQAMASSLPDALTGYLGELGGDYEQPGQQQPGQLPDDPLDPMYTPALLQAMEQRVGQMLDERMGGLGQTQEMVAYMAEQQGKEIAEAEFTKLEGVVGGKFDHDIALMRAQSMMERGADPNQALQQAAQLQYQHDEGQRQAGIKAYQDSLLATNTQQQQPGQNGVAAAPIPGVPTGANRYEEQLKRSLASMGRPNPEVPAG